MILSIRSSSAAGEYGEVYSCNYALARFLQAREDRWLSDHFFENCLKFSKFVQSDEGKKKAEAHCNIGLIADRNGIFSTTCSHGLNISKLLYTVFCFSKYLSVRQSQHLTSIVLCLNVDCADTDA